MDIGTYSPDKILVENASLEDLKRAIRDLYTLPFPKRYRYISVYEELLDIEMVIFTSAIVVTWYGKGVYDGPGSAAELFSGRVKEWCILSAIEDILPVFLDLDEKKLISLLQALPKA